MRDLSKTYGRKRRWDKDPGVRALDGIDLDVDAGELVAVVGPSGSGKSTLLRCIAGLESLDEGNIEIDGRDVTLLSPGERDVAMVFQDFALYPHLTVRENLSFGLKARRTNRKEIEERLADVTAALDIAEVLDRRPSHLSGGERQRVALGRALVRRPRVFLLDEPLSNLDAELRMHARREIKVLQQEVDAAMIYVTHDQTEAMGLGDRVVILRDGRVEQVASPDVIYDSPASAFVARFIGVPGMNLFPASLHGPTFGSLTIGVRPEHITLTDSDRALFRGRVVTVEPVGADALIHIEAQGNDIVARVPRRSLPSERTVGVFFEEPDIHLFEGPEGRSVR